ncbi:hypothetical protein PHMEG_00030087 [Phytophthora megakarya]|uniref:Integrase catalytic domain-containing protein n=1 Tax=Phytophthora megakarya TaxID=4795 RepID=A0A225UZN6_9STRA|nr:hypothetical protein PHMEG_00030087 [Phytophthora megakarya]
MGCYAESLGLSTTKNCSSSDNHTEITATAANTMSTGRRTLCMTNVGGSGEGAAKGTKVIVDDKPYLFALKDDACRFCELVVFELPTSDVAVEAILQWHSRLGIPKLWISEQGSHFTSDMMYIMCSKLNCDQRFSVAYCPWNKVPVERLNRYVLQDFRTMILEYKRDHRDWMALISVKYLRDCIHPHLLPTLSWSGEADGKQTLLNKRKERGKIRFVLRSRVDEKHLNKLLVTWVGPYVVTETQPMHFVVNDLVTGKSCDVHASRLKFFFADKYLQHRWKSERQGFGLFTNRRGLEEIEGSWEPFTPMARDVQALVDMYVTATENTQHAEHWDRLQRQPQRGGS